MYYNQVQNFQDDGYQLMDMLEHLDKEQEQNIVVRLY
jgi:hypothetical protein